MANIKASFWVAFVHLELWFVLMTDIEDIFVF